MDVLEFIRDGVVVTDCLGRITFMNAAAETILGVSKGDVLGSEWGDLVSSGKIGEVLRTGTKIQGVQQWYERTGRVVEESYYPVGGGRSVTENVVITLSDITETKRLLAQLSEAREIEERLQIVLRHINEAVLMIGRDTTVLYANPAYQRVIGVPPQKILGKKLSELEPGANILRVAETGQRISGPTRVDSVGVDVYFDAVPVRVGGELVGAVAIFRRLDEMADLLRQLEHLSLLKEELERRLAERDPLPEGFNSLVGHSGIFREALALAARVARRDTPVIIRGESGTGKELVARAIHMASHRKSGPFVRVNCAAIPEGLIESELFGYEPGAFTGAGRVGKPGKFELADGGTLFLDEIGDMSLATQAKLLRVLQEKEFERVGGIKTYRVNTRIIAATNRDLEQLVACGQFREDLYYRINVVSIGLPPLRKRKEDICPLVNHFLSRHEKETGEKVRLSLEAFRILQKYDWPGNVRELENAIEHGLAVRTGGIIQENDLPPYILSAVSCSQLDLRKPKDGNLREQLRQMEKRAIVLALRECGNNKTKAMKKLGMSRKLFYARLREYGLLKK